MIILNVVQISVNTLTYFICSPVCLRGCADVLSECMVRLGRQFEAGGPGLPLFVSTVRQQYTVHRLKCGYEPPPGPTVSCKVDLT